MVKQSDGISQYASDEDIFEDEEDRRNSWSFDGSAVLESLEEKCLSDQERLYRVQKLLSGVPPPPNFTNPQVSLEVALDRLKSAFEAIDELKKSCSHKVGNEVEAGYDIYYNRNNYVEEVEQLMPQVQEWLISNETSSLLTSKCQSRLTESAKKRSRTNGWLTSPGSRMNYLKRRKTTFSAMCLPATSNAPSRTLTMDRGKLLGKSKSEGKSSQGNKVCPKRALFQSPEKQMGGVNASTSMDYNIPSATSSSSNSSSIMLTPTRSLRTRLSTVSNRMCQDKKVAPNNKAVAQTSSEKKRCWRSLNFPSQSDAKEKLEPPNTADKKKLSKRRSRKLLWAVASLLKGEGVLSSDAEYLQLCSLLYKETSVVWLRDYEFKPRKPGSSTSNDMLDLATSMLPNIEQKAGVSLSEIRARRNGSVMISDPNSSDAPIGPLSVSLLELPSVMSCSFPQSDSEPCQSAPVDSLGNCDFGRRESESTDACPSENAFENSPSTSPSTLAKPQKQKTPKKIVTRNKNSIEQTSSKVKTPSKYTPSKRKTSRKTSEQVARESVDNVSKTPTRSSLRLNSDVSESVTCSSTTNSAPETPDDRIYPKRNRRDCTNLPKPLKCLEEEEGSSTISTPTNKLTHGNDEETIDKENNSAVKNSDSLNWSPVMRFKRMSRSKWSSELKKKKLSESSKTTDAGDEDEETEANSPNMSMPFLELEGPFKYRDANERALNHGSYIQVVLSGEDYSGTGYRLIRDREVTPSCILVKSTISGLELYIPVSLLKRETKNLGPHQVCDMVGDVLEDAVCRIEHYPSLLQLDNNKNEFYGFTSNEVLMASLNSFRMNRSIYLAQMTGSPLPKPLFHKYKYALITKSPSNSFSHSYCQIYVEIPLTPFLVKRAVDDHTILVRPHKSASPKSISLELNIPLTLVSKDDLSYFFNIIEDLKVSQKL